MRKLIPFILILLMIQPVMALDLHLFHTNGCPHCANLEEYLVDISDEKNITLYEYNAYYNQTLFKEKLQEYNVPSNRWGAVPTLFFDNQYCIGDTPCIEALENYFSGETNNQTNNTNNNPEKLTFTWITGLALVDAVNPCALAVLTLLLTTILLKDPTKKRNALLSGIAFSLSILICYFVLGTLIILGFKKAAAVASLSRPIFYQLLGGFAIIIGLLNLKDFFKFGAGGFVMEVPMSWRPRMKKIIRSATSPKGAFFVGIVVSLFLLPCTAGPYFVAGGILADVLWSTAFQWLFYYNLIFIIPMVAITIFVYLGLSKVEDVSGWRSKNIRYLHLFAGLILLSLGILMVLGIV